ncbi:hypothetical protein CEXT_290541 [Caerostris extrusa]|uniref:Uncharacterized protein n=1 Tax=Caerostris extrusa TaxID=172846 RepID=A0AAV4UTU8_CAEEX|nr:hypothetical protein CEXT_290541 [Caerostris extrusa]
MPHQECFGMKHTKEGNIMGDVTYIGTPQGSQGIICTIREDHTVEKRKPWDTASRTSFPCDTTEDAPY